MSKGRRRLVELGKDLLIVLLVASALWLASRPQLYGRQMNEWLGVMLDRSGQSSESNAVGEVDMRQIVKPVRMAVMTEQGRHGTPYDSAGTQQLFSGAADLLNEALSSAQQPERIRRAEWEKALQTAPGIYFEFPYDLPLPVLAELLSGGTHDSVLSGRTGKLCLTVTDGTVRLFYINEEDGLYYACSTDVVSRNQIETAVSGAVPNGTTFAFERQDCGNLASYTMLPDQTPEPVVYLVSNPMTEENRANLLKQLYFRNQSPDYEATDGMVYLDSGDTLRISGGGTVTYSASASEEKRFLVPAKGEQPTQAEYIYAAFWLVQRAMSPWQGAAELQLTRYEQREDGGIQAEFDYFINDSRVLQYNGDSAAVVLMENGQITGFVLQMHSYGQGTETTALLPVTQAAAAVSALDGDGGELVLCYHDDGGNALRAGWIVKR